MKIDNFIEKHFYWILAAIVIAVVVVYRKTLFPTLSLKIPGNKPDQPKIDPATGLDKSKTLKKGSTGPEVKALQNALNSLGQNPALTVDGNFGSKTESSLLLFAGVSETTLNKFTALTGAKF